MGAYTSTRLARSSMVASVCIAVSISMSSPFAAAETDELALEEIIVTAQKREQSLERVPVSVTAFTEDEIRRRSAVRITDLAFSMPNFVQVGSPNNSNMNYTIRGITTRAFNGGFESSLGVYLDGVILGRPFGYNQDLADVARVEVLRGAQGTLFGKNTIAGAINIITNKPVDKYEFSGSARIGNYGLFQGHVTSNLPVSDTLALRTTLFSIQRDGYIKNLNPAVPVDLDDEGAVGGRAHLRWQGEATDILLSVDGLRERRHILFGEASEIVGIPGPRTVNPNFTPSEDRDLRGVSLSVTTPIWGDHTLSSITARRDAEAITTSDSDRTALELANSIEVDDQWQFSQEFRLTSPEDQTFSYLAGLYYFHQSLFQKQFDFFEADFPELFGLTEPLSRDFRGTEGTIETDNYAAFANATYRFSDRIELFGGVRFDYEEKNLAFSQIGIEEVGWATLPTFTRNRSESNVAPSLGLNYFPRGDDLLLYAKTDRSFKSGGWNMEFLEGPENEFGAENLINYEIGLKAHWFNRRLRTNLAIFNQDYDDLQVTTFNPDTQGVSIQNAAAARSRGYEVELHGVPFDGVLIGLTYGYTDAEFTDFLASGGVDRSGERLPNAAEHTVSALIEFNRQIGDNTEIVLRADSGYRSEIQFSTAVRDPIFIQEVGSVNLVNAKIGVEAMDGQWAIYLWGRNLTDELYIQALGRNFAGVDNATYGPPRIYGLELSFSM